MSAVKISNWQSFALRNLFNKLAAALRGAPPSLLSPWYLKSLQRGIQNGEKPDYDRDWAGFSYLYFGANFYRTFYSLRHLPVNAQEPLRILDLGCGAGASSAGAVLALQAAKLLGSNPVLVGVDVNRKQTHLFQRVFCAWLRTHMPSAVPRVVTDNAVSFLRTHSDDGWHVIICSYLLLELDSCSRSELREKLMDAQARGAEVVIIDKPQGKSVAEFLCGATIPLTLRNVSFDLSPLLQLGVGVDPMYAK